MQLADGPAIRMPPDRPSRCRALPSRPRWRPALGVQVLLGTMRGQVVRHFDDGIAIEFAVVQDKTSLGDKLGNPDPLAHPSQITPASRTEPLTGLGPARP